MEIACGIEGLLTSAALAGLALVGLWAFRWCTQSKIRWNAAYWIEFRYEAIKKDPSLAVGVQRGDERVVTTVLRTDAADSEQFAKALAEAKGHASALNAASRTVAT